MPVVDYDYDYYYRNSRKVNNATRNNRTTGNVGPKSASMEKRTNDEYTRTRQSTKDQVRMATYEIPVENKRRNQNVAISRNSSTSRNNVTSRNSSTNIVSRNNFDLEIPSMVNKKYEVNYATKNTQNYASPQGRNVTQKSMQKNMQKGTYESTQKSRQKSMHENTEKNKQKNIHENAQRNKQKNIYESAQKPSEMKLKKPETLGEAKKEEKRKALNRVKTVFYLVVGFAIAFLICYRYSLINEKFNDVEKIKSELEVAKTVNEQLQADIDSQTDLSYIENYAKYQLGMQKPSNSQIKYVNVEKKDKMLTPVVIEEENEKTWFDEFYEAIMKLFE